MKPVSSSRPAVPLGLFFIFNVLSFSLIPVLQAAVALPSLKVLALLALVFTNTKNVPAVIAKD